MDVTDDDLTRQQDARTGLTGRFTRERDLGAAGYLREYLARDRAAGRQVLVRELHLPDGMATEERRLHERAFLREARILARLDHPAVPALHELGRRTAGALFAVMRPARGPTLRQVLDRTPRGHRYRLRCTVLDAARAVAHAHHHGVSHLDLAPVNVRVGEHGEGTVVGWSHARREEDGPVDLHADVIALAAMIAEIALDDAGLTAAAEAAIASRRATATDLVRALTEPPPSRRRSFAQLARGA